KVQSVPAPGEAPQVFETIEAIEAYPEWNAIKPRLTFPHPLRADLESVTVTGIGGLPKVGETLLLVTAGEAEEPVVRRVTRAIADQAGRTTRLDLGDPPALLSGAEPPAVIPPSVPASAVPGRFFTGQVRLTDAFTAAAFGPGIAWRQDLLLTLARHHRWGLRHIETHLRSRPLETLPASLGVFAFRARAALFGHNAPKARSGPPAVEGLPDLHTLEDEQKDSGRHYVYLDRGYPGIVPGGYVVLESPAAREVYQVLENLEVSRAEFGLAAKTTRLALDHRRRFNQLMIRETTVYAESEPLALAPLPIPDPIAGSGCVLDGAYLGLGAGRTAVLSGELADLKGVRAAEAVRIAEAVLVDGDTRLGFETALAHRYLRETTSLNANVAAATQGESKNEVLGGGDGTRAFQTFPLRQPPLTHVTAASPTGTRTTLEVRVNDLLWEEVPSFHGRGSGERVYTTRQDDRGSTVVVFGDGVTGARLPTGQENVRASYRRGIGAPGLLRAGQLSLLLSRPLGVREVTNPLDTAGAADPENLAQIRENLPLALRSLDRIVSLRDYEDFARAFAGIDKAQASRGTSQGKRSVLLSVAGTDGAVIDPQGPLARNLVAAVLAAGNPRVPVLLAPHRPMFFRLAAKLRIAPERRPEQVLAAVHERLLLGFGFRARALGQAVALSELMAAIHAVPGVEAVHVSGFYRIDEEPEAPPPAQLLADPPRGGAITLGAELLSIDPGTLAAVGVFT
ncbi:MAG: putative baseplate assembly protein, partial [Candidatus Rokubacteria bacterium]|nr:putative baseplate assembly protein [Candidatus Rokubacteria bacterium]